MNGLTDRIASTNVSKGCAALWWLAQAGFVFKSPEGRVIYLDPYLSDLVERTAGFKRLSLAPVRAEEVRADWLITSHEHADHLDTDSIRIIAGTDAGCIFAGPKECVAEFTKCGIAADRQLVLEPHRSYDLGDVKLHTCRADHGELSPCALAMLFDFGGARIFFTGDTAYNLEYLRPLAEMKPNLILPCINGSYGNLNADEAARLTAWVGAKAAIPCHFWMFKEHHTAPNGDPQSFFMACETLCPETDIRLLTPGEGVLVTSDSIEGL